MHIRPPLDVVGDVCFHARPVNACSGQAHCLVDAGMASMDICHNIVSAGWWNDHSFTLGEVTVDGEFILEAPVESGRSGDTTLSVRPTVQGESVHN